MVKDIRDNERGNPLPLMAYSFQLAANDPIYSPYPAICYTSCGMRTSSMGPPCGNDPTTHHTEQTLYH